MSQRTTRDIPEQMRHEMSSATQSYAVCLLGAVGDPDSGNLKFCGSATLVQLDGSHYFLSAAHVWKEIASCRGLGLTIREYPHSFIRPVGAYIPRVLRADSFGEWGPDLVIVRIP